MISVIIPTYNKADRLIQTINQIKLVGSADLEIVVVDDASTDHTKTVIRKFKKIKIEYVCNKSNLGTSKSRIVGLERAAGDCVLFFDDDDDLNSYNMQQAIHQFQKNQPDIIIANYTVNNLIDGVKYKKDLSQYEKNFNLHIVKSPGPFFQCSLFKTSFIKQYIHLFDSASEPSEDWDFFLSLAPYKWTIEHIDVELFQWNLSEQSQSSNFRQETEAIEYIILKHKQSFLKYGTCKILAKHYRILGARYFFINRVSKSSFFYNLAFLVFPWNMKNIFHKIIQTLPNFIKLAIYVRLNKKIIS